MTLPRCGGKSEPGYDIPDDGESGSEATDLQIEIACGRHTAQYSQYSEFVDDGEACQVVLADGLPSFDLNTFALRLAGADRHRYSAVVRCGYIRYDNGIFVGERVAVEARDGEWCHDAALEHIELTDRMLLTDVSFEIEAIDLASPEQNLSVQFLTREGWTQEISAETNLCAYVAHHQYGAYACSLAPALPYCECPSGDAWHDFFTAVRLRLSTH